MKTVVPCSGDDQKIVLQAFVGLRKAGYQPYLVGPGFQVIRLIEAMTFIQVNYIVPLEAEVHLFVQSVYTPQDSEHVHGALVGGQPMTTQIIPSYSPYGDHHSSFYESYHWNGDLSHLSLG